MKILILDIETSPHTGFHWGLFQQNISIGQLIESSSVLCWAAKWLGEKKVYFSSIFHTTFTLSLIHISEPTRPY